MSINAETIRLLLARSGGYCQKPDCNTDLFQFLSSRKVTNIREMAHIIPRRKGGPRGQSSAQNSDLDSYENLIMLCPTCHTIVDKNEDDFPVELLHKWKAEHERTIRSCFHVPVFQDRRELRKQIDSLLERNRSVWKCYGPNSAYSSYPLSDAADMWQRECLEVIIPNNRKVSELLLRNSHLLRIDEQEVVTMFILHKEGFEYNHLSGDKNSSVPLFPNEIYEILGE